MTGPGGVGALQVLKRMSRRDIKGLEGGGGGGGGGGRGGGLLLAAAAGGGVVISGSLFQEEIDLMPQSRLGYEINRPCPSAPNYDRGSRHHDLWCSETTWDQWSTLLMTRFSR